MLTCCNETGPTALVHVRCEVTLNGTSTPQGFFPAGDGAARLEVQVAILRKAIEVCKSIPFSNQNAYSWYNLAYPDPIFVDPGRRITLGDVPNLYPVPWAGNFAYLVYRSRCGNVFPSVREIIGAVSEDFSAGSAYAYDATRLIIYVQKARLFFAQETAACINTFRQCNISNGIAENRASSNVHIMNPIDPTPQGGLIYSMLIARSC